MMESWGAEATCALLAAQMNLSKASRGLLGLSLARDAVWGATPTLLPVAVAFPAVNCLSSCHQIFPWLSPSLFPGVTGYARLNQVKNIILMMQI